MQTSMENSKNISMSLEEYDQIMKNEENSKDQLNRSSQFMQNIWKTPEVLNENELKISGCPCDIDMHYFENFFLPQLMIKHPKIFAEGLQNVKHDVKKLSTLQDVEITLNFKT